MRKFEFVKRLEDTDDLKLPERSTKNSAGYDFYAIKDITIEPSICGINLSFIRENVPLTSSLRQYFFDKPVLVKTGIKVKMEDDEVLLLVNRSSNPSKKNLIIPNSIGVIDADYYGNSDNDGEMCFTFYNVGAEPITIKKGEKLGQGIFMKYLVTDNDNADGERTGGFGSTDNMKGE